MFLPSYVMRTHGFRKQQDAIKDVPAKQIRKVFEVQKCWLVIWLIFSFSVFILDAYFVVSSL